MGKNKSNKNKRKPSTRKDNINLEQITNNDLAWIEEPTGCIDGKPAFTLRLVKNEKIVIGSLTGKAKKGKFACKGNLVQIEPLNDKYKITHIIKKSDESKLKRMGRLKRTVINNSSNENENENDSINHANSNTINNNVIDTNNTDFINDICEFDI